MQFLKRKSIYASLILVLILSLSFMFGSYLNSSNQLATREVDVDSIGTLSYEEKVEQLKSKFNNIDVDEDENSFYFSGELKFSTLELLSTNYEGENVIEKYNSVINKEDESITISKELMVNDETESFVSEKFLTEYDELTDTYYLVEQNGNKINLLTELQDKNINNCFVLSMILSIITVKEIVAICAIVAVAIIAVNADTIANDISNLVSGVRDGFTSFWDKLKLAFGGITAVPLKSAIAILTVAQAEKIYEKAKQRKDCYLLLAPISQTEPISILYKFANLANARNWIRKGGSIWSPYATTTKTAIKEAGYSAGGTNGGNVYVVNLKEHHASYLGLPTFDHYHTIIGNKRVNESCHGFFGLPYID